MLHACMLNHFSRVRLFVALWTVDCQGPVSTGFSWKEYWIGLPFPSPGDLPDPGIEPVSLAPSALAGRFFASWATGEAQMLHRCCCSVAQSCLTPFDPMDCNMPGFPVFCYLPEFAQTQAHWVSHARQPSHPLSPPSPSLCYINKC